MNCTGHIFRWPPIEPSIVLCPCQKLQDKGLVISLFTSMPGWFRDNPLDFGAKALQLSLLLVLLFHIKCVLHLASTDTCSWLTFYGSNTMCILIMGNCYNETIFQVHHILIFVNRECKRAKHLSDP